MINLFLGPEITLELLFHEGTMKIDVPFVPIRTLLPVGMGRIGFNVVILSSGTLHFGVPEDLVGSVLHIGGFRY
jgi:hypothetical protein